MIRAFLILLLVASTAQATFWDQGIKGELHWKEQLVLEDYTLTLADFSLEDKLIALVELEEEGRPIARRALHVGEWFIINDSLRVSVLEIGEGEDEGDPYAIVRLQLLSAPEISLLLNFDKDLYRGGEDMKILLKVENRGAVDAEDLKIVVDCVPPLFSRRINISSLPAGSAWDDRKKTVQIDPIKIYLQAPYLPEAADLEVRAHAQYKDPEGNAYQSWGGSRARISGPLLLHKRVEENQDFSESYYVINSLSNSGNRTLKVDLVDSTGEGFCTNDTLLWRILIPPGQTKTVSYKIKAKEPGLGLSLPDAIASFSLGEWIYTVHSNQPMVDVVGPWIDVRRRISPQKVRVGEEVTITMELENQGNRKAVLTLAERVPQGAELIRGEIDESFMLSPGEKALREIRLRVLDREGISIPASTVVYRDVRGNEYATSTSPLRIKVAEEKSIKASHETDMMVDGKSGVQRADDVQADNISGMEQNLSMLFILIILLLSAALARYS